MIYKIGSRNSEIIFTKHYKDFTDESNVYIIDETVANLYAFNLKNSYIFKASEENKNHKTLNEIYAFFSKTGVTRNTNVVAIGGGTTLDIGGFAAATYKRGTKLIYIPTTLLAQVDASLGGKTAINFENIKNLIGTFYSADKIIIDDSFLKTLPRKEVANGFAEIFKTALIENNGVLSKLKKFEIDTDIIKRTVRTKMEICQKDPFDQNIRKYLNLGHTFAHILESISNYAVPHGLAVATGIITASYLSYKLRYLTYDQFSFIKKTVSQFDFTPVTNHYHSIKNIDDKIILQDKKNDNAINLILLSSIFKPFIYKTNKINLIKEILVKTIDLIK